MNRILQQAAGKYLPMLDAVKEAAEAYALRTKSEYIPLRGCIGRIWTAAEKFLYPLSFMRGSGGLIFLWDADVWPVGDEHWPNAMGDAEFAAVPNVFGELNIGVYMIRDTPKMLGMLLRCVRRFPAHVVNTGTPFCEQSLLNQELKLCGAKYKVLNRRWNEYGRAAGKLDGAIQIKGFHDLSTAPHIKLKQMQNWSAQHAKAI